MIQNLAQTDESSAPARLQTVLLGGLRMHNVSRPECRKLKAIVGYALDTFEDRATLAAFEAAITDYAKEEDE